MAKVRKALPADTPRMLEMGRALHAESPRYAQLNYSDVKVADLVRRLVVGTLVTEPEGGVFVAETEGNIIGMIGGYLFEPFYSFDKIATDYTFYVDPKHRGVSSAASRLLDAFEAWAKAKGAVEILPGTTTMINAEQTVRFYERKGYERYGYVFRKKVK